MSMAAHLKRGLARMVAARDVMLRARSARSEALQRFRTFASARLNDFVVAVDAAGVRQQMPHGDLISRARRGQGKLGQHGRQRRV